MFSLRARYSFKLKGTLEASGGPRQTWAQQVYLEGAKPLCHTRLKELLPDGSDTASITWKEELDQVFRSVEK